MTRPTLAPVLLALATGGCFVHLEGLHFTGVYAKEQAQRVDLHALDLAPGETLRFDTDFGDVTVGGSTDGRAELTTTLHGHGRTLEEAEAVLARYSVVLERGPEGLTVRLAGEPLQVDGEGYRAGLVAHADFVAIVPAGTPLVARSGSGALRAHGGLGACRLESANGSITAEDVRGDLFAKSGSGDVSAARVEGGTITLATTFGDVRLEGARATRVECETDSGAVTLADCAGDEMALETTFGAVHAREAHGTLRARSDSGDVRLHGVHGAIDAKSGFGAVEVDGILAGLAAVTDSGSVNVRARPGSAAAAGWKLRSTFGPVTLSAPDDFACELDARTHHGEVECAFPITIDGGQLGRDGKLKGRIGSGGGSVSLASDSGRVALKKL